MIVSNPEEWAPIPGWRNYVAGDRGHVRHRSKTKSLSRIVDTDGVQYVTLRKRTNQEEYQIDQLVCSAFHGSPPNNDLITEHIDGVLWNNWASNLRWAYPVMASKWYGGPVKDAIRGFFRYGPFKTKIELSRLLSKGDVLIGKGDNGKLVAFEFVFWRGDDSLNPFDMARFFRAHVNYVMEIEKLKGMDIVIEANPYAAAQKYHELANLHPEFMWARYLHEAADMIEVLANEVRSGIDHPVTVVPSVRTPVPIPVAPVHARPQPKPVPPRISITHGPTTVDNTPATTPRTQVFRTGLFFKG